MEKFSILLFGKNKVLINDFFMYHEDNLECLSASNNSDDILNHLKYYHPDAFVYCMQEETSEEMKQIKIVNVVKSTDIPLIIIGQPSECKEFQALIGSMEVLVLRRPLYRSQIQEQIISYIIAKRRELLKQETAEMTRKRILVVDDDPLMLKMMNEYLHGEYEVATAINGKIAMKYLSSKTVDLILLDYQMPEESGPEIMEQLQKNEATKDIPVIFLTGVKERDKIQKALALKPNGYLLKPIERDKLMEVITNQFSPTEENQ